MPTDEGPKDDDNFSTELKNGEKVQVTYLRQKLRKAHLLINVDRGRKEGRKKKREGEGIERETKQKGRGRKGEGRQEEDREEGKNEGREGGTLEHDSFIMK